VDLRPDRVRVDLDVERDPVAGAMADAVGQELGDQQAQRAELLLVDRSLEPVERVAALMSGLRTRAYLQQQP